MRSGLRRPALRMWLRARACRSRRCSGFAQWSMSKLVIAVATMKLVEEGKVRLNDPLSRFLPAFVNMKVARLAAGNASDDTPRLEYVDIERPITIMHLLSHTSGIPHARAFTFFSNPLFQMVGKIWDDAGVLEGCWKDADLSLEESVDKMASLPLVSQPGTEHVYGLNNDVLGRVIEIASGMKLSAYLSEHVYGPLGMNSTAFFLHPETSPRDKGMLSRLATLYANDGAKLHSCAPDVPDRDPFCALASDIYYKGFRNYEAGGCGLLSTITDFGNVGQMLANGGVAPNGQRFLSSTMVQSMFYNRLSVPGDFPLKSMVGDAAYDVGFGFGLGGFVFDHPEKSMFVGPKNTYGWTGAHSTVFFVFPEQRASLVFMTQCHFFSAGCGAKSFDIIKSMFTLASAVLLP